MKETTHPNDVAPSVGGAVERGVNGAVVRAAGRVVGFFLWLGLWFFPSFGLQAQFTYTNLHGSLIITGYQGEPTSVRIPEAIDHLPVAGIGARAFKDRTALTDVTLPNSVTRIGNQAFDGCSGLTNVDWGHGVAFIGNLAFSGCVGLTSVTLPDSVQSIGRSAFFQCYGLTRVTIGKGVTGIEKSAFADCRSLTHVVFGDSVTTIGAFAFGSCSSLKSLVITNSLTSIGPAAFSGCSGLTNAILGRDLVGIGNTAFGSCLELTTITFLGNRPREPRNLFLHSTPTVLYLPETSGWGETFAGRPTRPWNRSALP